MDIGECNFVVRNADDMVQPHRGRRSLLRGLWYRGVLLATNERQNEQGGVIAHTIIA